MSLINLFAKLSFSRVFGALFVFFLLAAVPGVPLQLHSSTGRKACAETVSTRPYYFQDFTIAPSSCLDQDLLRRIHCWTPTFPVYP